MTLEEAIKWFCNLGYREDENGITHYSDYNYKKSIEVIRDALKNGELVIKGNLKSLILTT